MNGIGVKPGEPGLSPALSDLAGVARVDQVDGPPQDWVAILQGELRFARDSQDQLPALGNREIEQAVIGTFLHSQPQGGNHARIGDLHALVGASKPDRIALEKGIQAWAVRSWFLDEVHLDSAEKRPDGSRGVPRTWRLGFQPSLKQMHDDARVNRVGKTAVDEMLLDEIKAARWLDAGASTLGAKVHKLPTGPDQVPGDGEFRYVILGPNTLLSGTSLAFRIREQRHGLWHWRSDPRMEQIDQGPAHEEMRPDDEQDRHGRDGSRLLIMQHPHQQIGDESHRDLNTHGILGFPHEAGDLQVLLDPLEERKRCACPT